MMGFLP
jgi:hypothetical protein